MAFVLHINYQIGNLLLWGPFNNVSCVSSNLYQKTNILDPSKFKAFVDDKINVPLIMGYEENIVGKGELAGYPLFLSPPNNVFKSSYNGGQKPGIW